MSETTDLGSPDRDLSARDIKRKKDKLENVIEKLKNPNLSGKRRHNLEFKKEKTLDQITTRKSGIRPVKQPYDGVSRKSPLNIVGIRNITEGVKNVVDAAIDTHWKGEEDAWRKSGKGNVPDSAYAVYDRGRRTKFGPGMGKGDQGPKGAFEYDTPRLRTKYEDNPGDDKTHSYKSWKK